MNNKNVELTQRDIEILKAVNKFRILNTNILLLFGYFSTPQRCNKRVQELCQIGLINKERLSRASPYLYTITGKGLSLLIDVMNWNISQKSPRPYKLNLESTRYQHELLVAEVCAELLKQNPQITIDDIQTERDYYFFADYSSKGTYARLKKLSKYRADVWVQKLDLVIELELKNAKQSELMNKVMFFKNEERNQLWIFKQSRIKNHDFVKELPLPKVKSIYLDEIHQENLKYDLVDYQAALEI